MCIRDSRVIPAGLWFRFGHWYLVAWDLEREAVRTFRVCLLYTSRCV